jgi:hypothetical protein
VALTPAERQRRSRAHRRGDHSLCELGRCDAVTAAVTAVTSADVTPDVTAGPLAPPDLDARGRWLWAQLSAGDPPPPEQQVLIAEACRIADRLDRLDALLRDEDTWARLQVPDNAAETGEVRLVVNAAIGEARQQALALKGLAAELRAAKATGRTPAKEGSVLDQLAARRATRRANATG